MLLIARLVSNIQELKTMQEIIDYDSDSVPFITAFSKSTGEVVVRCQENVLVALRNDPQLRGKFRYNMWLERKETMLEWHTWRQVRDNDYNLIKSILANTYQHQALISASTEFVISAVTQYCEENSFDPAKDYFSSLVWDGIPRIDTWLISTYHTDDTSEYRAFGSQWMKAMVKRVMVPGCKFDHVLVLEGAQGVGKSTSLKVLGNIQEEDWHLEMTTNPNDKDFFMLMRGKMIVEFSEGEIQERSSMKLLKSIITQQTDVYRNPYGRETEEHPRRCVFAMTTNDSKYLKDETGNRRWLPIECNGSVDIEWLKENKEQLYAEAYHRAITLKESLYEGLYTDEVRELQESRRIERVEEELIVDWYIGTSYRDKENGFTLREIYDLAIGKGREGMVFNQLHNQVLPPIITNVLKLKMVRRLEDNGQRLRKYYPTEATYKIFPKEPEQLF